MKIGILGGTFNPVHEGHLQLALAAKRQFSLDQVWLMPAKYPPHKRKQQLIADAHRLEMLALSVKAYPELMVSLFEYERETLSYTYDTLRLLHERYPEDEFYYICGEDSLQSFPTWFHPAEIAQMATLLIASRDADAASLTQLINCRRKQFTERIYAVDTPWLPISSTDVRIRLRIGLPITGDVPAEVEQYMLKNQLYQTSFEELCAENPSGKPEWPELVSMMQKTLPEKRFRHVMGVAYTAYALAIRYAADPGKAAIAGLMHDCAKCFSDKELIKKCREYRILITVAEEKNPQLLHAKYGAFLAEKKYGIRDPEILSAITYHTTGRPGMTILERIVYLADYIEPGRKQKTEPALEQIRILAFDDLNQCIMTVADCTVEYLEACGTEMDDMTMQTKEYYEKQQAVPAEDGGIE